jgi:hypothetical protein
MKSSYSEWKFKKSRWFIRGWALQKLLAPDTVEFYDQDWNWPGPKLEPIAKLKSVTQIELTYLLHRESIRGAGIATKFSWAASRETTRVKDKAYCLLSLA